MAKRGAVQRKPGSLPMPFAGQEMPKCKVIAPAFRGGKHNHWRVLVVCLACQDGMIREVEYNWTFVENGGSWCYSCSATDNGNNKSHGMCGTRTYLIWQCLMVRMRVGYKGRTCPKEWYTFEGFFADMGKCPPDKYTLDRIDNTQPYGWIVKPDGTRVLNCRYADYFEQNNNRSDNRYIMVGNERLTLAQAGRKIGVSDKKLRYHMIQEGRTLDVAIEAIKSGKRILSGKPIKGGPVIEYQNEPVSLFEAIRRSGAPRASVAHYFYTCGLSFDEALARIAANKQHVTLKAFASSQGLSRDALKYRMKQYRETREQAAAYLKSKQSS